MPPPQPLPSNLPNKAFLFFYEYYKNLSVSKKIYNFALVKKIISIAYPPISTHFNEMGICTKSMLFIIKNMSCWDFGTKNKRK